MRDYDFSKATLVLQEAVRRLTDLYQKQYRCEPRYVKIPEYLYPKLKLSYASYLREDADARDKPIDLFMGLIVCPTPSITDFDEIEVF